MRLTTYTDFSLRMLIYLAVNIDRSVTIQEIAQSFRISRAHLMKVAHQLGVMGYIETTRGRNGGLRLALEAHEIELAEVVARTEPDMALVPCFSPRETTCAIVPVCVLRRVTEEARAAFMDVLGNYTLADLAAPKSKLKSLLAHAHETG